MVHKKSEYRLSYKWIPSDLCKQTWESGHSYRLQRRQYDLSHMPLPWESHGCECDVDDGGGGDDDLLLPVPKMRLKHNILNEVWDQDAQRHKDSPTQAAVTDKWYRHWEEQEHHVKPHPAPVKAAPPKFIAEKNGAKTSQAGEDRDSSKNEARREAEKNFPDVRALERGYDGLNADISLKRNGLYSDELKREPVRPRSSSQFANAERGTQTFDRWRSLSPRRQKLDVAATQPAAPQLTKPKIIPYGWASQRDVGDKRTFNIYAPTRDKSQFHSSALRAWKRKERDIYQMPERETTHPKPTERIPRIHHGDLWTTEYQQQYNDQKYCCRPASAPSARWRNIGHVYHQCHV